MKDKIKNYLQKVYGVDFFSKTMIVFALILSLINLKFKNRVIEIITMILIVYFGIFRVFSVNKYQRMIENQKFAKAVKPMTDFFEKYKIRAVNSKDKKYIKCPNCKKEMKIPRNKGKIKVTCPHCGHKFVKKS
ncbi:hypothetical protein [Finegoldia magna]|uniref:hypothetical protein n=1 Tax=Finegoldia magna TaxID=1260 RepID=UPI0001DE51AA|nr:hypothetical protein [Finegoldia magna]EFK94179.1 hypothetical protein HMPREF9261_1465 [Finegoldia magna ACS-171-V-Col3]MDU1213175.1 hypothetical protein [Finegoldia magna]MDU5185863.1 hypothetical protein [Finegoldia magna]MDU5922086.1 hypothetical protein [Finegoldia magna]MDU5970641.1 hypothetical protein [Finegoldia magna]